MRRSVEAGRVDDLSAPHPGRYLPRPRYGTCPAPAAPQLGTTQDRSLNVIVVMPVGGGGPPLPPHPHVPPKPLLKVGDKPVLSYILDDLRQLGVHEAVLVTGHLKEKVQAFMESDYPDFHAEYVEQVEQRGTADAIRYAEPFVHEELMIIFV